MIYFDYAATTPLRREAREAMEPYLGDNFGNPSATYHVAKQAGSAVDRAREDVAGILGCTANEVVFTSGGTESINAAIKGVAFAQRFAGVGNHIVTTAIEHHAVLHSCQYLERFGFDVTYLPVNRSGQLQAQDLSDAINDRTVLVSIMTANNEIGVVAPIRQLTDVVRARAERLKRRIPFHTDAVQAANALVLRVDDLGVDLLSLSAHKFSGPKGTGILYMRRGTPFLSQQSGGGQERQRRAGTENVAGIVATARALQLATAERDRFVTHCRNLQEKLVSGITDRLPGASLNGHPDERLPNNVSVSLPGADARILLRLLDEAGIAASAGAACNEETLEPSHVLLALDTPLPQAAGTLRFSFGLQTTEADIDRLLDVLPAIVPQSQMQPTPAR